MGERHDEREERRRLLDRMQAVMGPLPDETRRVPLDLRIEDEARVSGIRRLKVSFAVEPDDRVPAWLLIPGGAGRRAAVLCLHQTTAIGKGEPAGLGGHANLQYAMELARRGSVTLAPDYPGFGEYRCDPYALGYASATMKGIWNHMRAVDLLQTLAEADPGRIGCIGHSLGGHNTLFLGAFDDRIRAMACSCGFTAFARYKGGNLAGWSHRGYMPRIATAYGCDPRRVPFDFPALLSALAPRPLFVNAPRRDDNFDVAGVEACLAVARPVYERLGAGSRLVVVHPEGGHDFEATAREAAYAFLEAALR